MPQTRSSPVSSAYACCSFRLSRLCGASGFVMEAIRTSSLSCPYSRLMPSLSRLIPVWIQPRFSQRYAVASATSRTADWYVPFYIILLVSLADTHASFLADVWFAVCDVPTQATSTLASGLSDLSSEGPSCVDQREPLRCVCGKTKSHIGFVGPQVF